MVKAEISSANKVEANIADNNRNGTTIFGGSVESLPGKNLWVGHIVLQTKWPPFGVHGWPGKNKWMGPFERMQKFCSKMHSKPVIGGIKV